MKRILFLILLTAILFASCKKDTVLQYNPNITGELSVEFDNVAGAADLQLKTGSYKNATGETFKVSMLKYFVSNFKLTKTDGTVYVVPQDSCYFLIDESALKTHQPILKVPEGEYKTLTFTLGVDSLRNTMDIKNRTGNLDPAGIAAGMYWAWNSGYIFFKMEGTSAASTQSNNAFLYHIGLYGGRDMRTINNIKTITLDLATRGAPQIKVGKKTNVHLMVDILKMFNGSTNISIALNPVVMISPFSANIANNYTAMFTHDHTEN